MQLFNITLTILLSAPFTIAELLEEPDIRLQARRLYREADLQAESKRLQGRDLPPCTPCDPPHAADLKHRKLDHSLLSKLNAEQEKAKKEETIYDKDYIPPVCNRKHVNCMYLAPNVTYIKGGLTPPIGHWNRSDGSIVWAWNYWQSTLLFSGKCGSITTYPAHCTIYTCVKGYAFAHIYDNEKGQQNFCGDMKCNDKSEPVCTCSYKLDSDQYFGLLKKEDDDGKDPDGKNRPTPKEVCGKGDEGTWVWTRFSMADDAISF
ncbi:hypothetical protein HII31_08013 [Pseudocercospora fuligena]|uniref:Cyanovirin-N domain-containing protein n=1 Tax=Pseudocercospora fuligena TaxID=685502 RepID=A0A8H6RG03_9PEZI|nr:hypothetical protein HII31_08013 [Pseudocercospora fuligena]